MIKEGSKCIKTVEESGDKTNDIELTMEQCRKYWHLRICVEEGVATRKETRIDRDLERLIIAA
jgi:hypothetical protein